MDFKLISYKIGIPSNTSLLLTSPLMNQHNLHFSSGQNKLRITTKRRRHCRTQATTTPPSQAVVTQLPPGPRQLPLIGNIHQLLSDLPHHVLLRDLSRTYGPIMLLRLGEVNHVVISSREGAEEIMRAQDVNFAYRPELSVAKVVFYDYKSVAFSPYGSYWKQLRRICSMELLSGKCVRSFSTLRAEEVTYVMSDISTAAAGDKLVNIPETITTMTNNIVCRASFGNKCPNQPKFIALMSEVVQLVSGFNVADLFPSIKFIDNVTGIRRKIKTIHREVDEIFNATIQQHQMSHHDDDRQDLVDILLHLKDHGDMEIPITMDTVKAVIFDVFTGGTETTSTIVEWVMSELMRNPKVMEKAQNEVREAMKGKTRVEESEICKLNYLNSIVKETLRLHPPAPLLAPRMCKETCQVLGYTIPAGTRVFTNVWAMGRNPQYWEDAEIFKPERFDNHAIDYKGQHFEFIPFGAGRRICPGISFGMVNAELVLTSLLYYFDWKLPHGMKPQDLDMTEAFGISAHKKSELCLLATPRYPLPHV